MIHEKLLELKAEIEANCGKIIRITLDKKANKALRDEFTVPTACGKTIFGIVIDQAHECPTCGQTKLARLMRAEELISYYGLDEKYKQALQEYSG